MCAEQPKYTYLFIMISLLFGISLSVRLLEGLGLTHAVQENLSHKLMACIRKQLPILDATSTGLVLIESYRPLESYALLLKKPLPPWQ